MSVDKRLGRRGCQIFNILLAAAKNLLEPVAGVSYPTETWLIRADFEVPARDFAYKAKPAYFSAEISRGKVIFKSIEADASVTVVEGAGPVGQLSVVAFPWDENLFRETPVRVKGRARTTRR